MFRIVYTLLLSFLLVAISQDASACSQKVYIDQSASMSTLFKQPRVTYIVQGVVDLHGKTFQIPEDCTLSLAHGALVNGVLNGNQTKLKNATRNSIGVVLSGSWACSSFSDLAFQDRYLTDNQIFACINSLQSDNVKQKICIERTEYHCDIPKNDGALLVLTSNTTLRIGSTISINGNDFTSYNVIRIKGKNNVTVSGGEIHGDVGKHQYALNNSSQWGHGINIHSSSNVSISDIVITHCIGDGIAISGGNEEHIGDYSSASHNVNLSNVTARYNRRQGLSIIHASDVIVRNCNFSDTGVIEKHSPSAGIDIEPNTASPYFQAVRNVSIVNCTIYSNVGYGILSNHYENHNGMESVENVVFKDCSTDSRVVLYTGGIHFEDCSMKQLSISAEKDPIIGARFILCHIAGGDGVQFYCPNGGKDVSTKIGDILFDGCDISATKDIASTSQGILWSNGKTSRLRNVSMRNCKISIPKTAPSRFKLLGDEEADIRFENCDINIPGRLFPVDKARRSNCKIISSNINE